MPGDLIIRFNVDGYYYTHDMGMRTLKDESIHAGWSSRIIMAQCVIGMGHHVRLPCSFPSRIYIGLQGL